MLPMASDKAKIKFQQFQDFKKKCRFTSIITYSAKLLNAYWSMKRVFFFLRGAKLLAHNWSSGHQATTHSIKKFFFCNNGISFQDS